MTQQRNIHGWHLLSLALAVVAGSALTLLWSGVGSNTKTPDVPTNASASTPASSAAELPSDPKQENLSVTNADALARQDDEVQTSTDSASELDDIPLFLQNEIEDLRFEIERSREDIVELKEQLAVLSTTTPDTASSAASGGNTTDISAPVDTFRRRQQPRALERDALIQAGVAPDVIDSIQQRQDQQSLDRLELFDRAARESYLNSDRLVEELEQFDEASVSLRDELGDAAYDQYLHNTGQPNRVVVASVISGSTADVSGIQLGDVILGYASSRVFTQQDLRDATRDGVRDEPVVLDILRNQQPLTLDAVRGPLGISMTTTSVAP